MKYLYIIRHAKSSWAQADLKDIDRPLNKRGIHDAPKMADYLHEQLDGKLDLIYSSPANRALTTAKQFHARFSLEEEIDIRRDIYFGDINEVIHIIQETENKYQSVAIFGHNPTFTYLLNYLASANIDNLPTCGIAGLKCQIDDWKSLDPEQVKLENLFLPKKLLY